MPSSSDSYVSCILYDSATWEALLIAIASCKLCESEKAHRTTESFSSVPTSVCVCVCGWVHVCASMSMCYGERKVFNLVAKFPEEWVIGNLWFYFFFICGFNPEIKTTTTTTVLYKNFLCSAAHMPPTPLQASVISERLEQVGGGEGGAEKEKFLWK